MPKDLCGSKATGPSQPMSPPKMEKELATLSWSAWKSEKADTNTSVGKTKCAREDDIHKHHRYVTNNSVLCDRRLTSTNTVPLHYTIGLVPGTGQGPPNYSLDFLIGCDTRPLLPSCKLFFLWKKAFLCSYKLIFTIIKKNIVAIWHRHSLFNIRPGNV